MFSTEYRTLSRAADDQGCEIIAHIERQEYRPDGSITGHCILRNGDSYRLTGFTVREDETSEFFGGHHGLTEARAWMLLGQRVTDQMAVAREIELQGR